MSKRRRSKIGGTERAPDPVTCIERATAETVSRLGMGGYVPANEFCQLFDTMTAELFAEIMYATEYMLVDYEGDEAVNAANVPETIARHKRSRKSHFHEVADIFVRHVGSEMVSLQDPSE